MVYLARTRGKRSLRLEAIQIEVDAASRKPRIVAGCRPVALESDAALTPPLMAADGMSVIGVSRRNGQLIRYHLDRSLDLHGRLAMAGRSDRPGDVRPRAN
jgi:hypothetical protein